MDGPFTKSALASMELLDCYVCDYWRTAMVSTFD